MHEPQSRSGEHRAQVQPVFCTPADDQMLEGKVAENIKKMAIDTVKIEVKNGEITLSGEVKKADLAKVMQAANEAKPKKVNNNLTVK